MSSRQAIEFFKAWLLKVKVIEYTGRVANANRLARILPLYQGFVMSHMAWFEEHMGYLQAKKRRPGQLAHIYPFFRDHVLLQGLREVVAELWIVHVDKVPPVRFFCKKQRRRDGRATPRSVIGWERVKIR
jgi:hypothetical protein